MISSRFLFNLLENLQAISYNRRYEMNSEKKTNTLITVLFSYFNGPNKKCYSWNFAARSSSKRITVIRVLFNYSSGLL